MKACQVFDLAALAPEQRAPELWQGGLVQIFDHLEAIPTFSGMSAGEGLDPRGSLLMEMANSRLITILPKTASKT